MRKTFRGLIDYIATRYDRVAEIGIGHFPDVALALSRRGLRVFATDVKEFCHNGVDVIRDDISEPDISAYRGVQLLYALRPPPELVPYMTCLAKGLPADLIAKPLASDRVGGRLIRHKDSTFCLWKFL